MVLTATLTASQQHARAGVTVSTATKYARVFGMALAGSAASLVTAITVNLALFRFGPWADVWVEQTWLGLAIVGAVVAYATRRRWLGDPVLQSRRFSGDV